MILTDTSTMSSEEIKTEYTSSLADLTFNSKLLINVLTTLAEENVANAAIVVAAIEEHLAKIRTDIKLPVLYLVDCIAKRIGETYTSLFSQNIVHMFCSVFKVVDEKARAKMFKLRQTWIEIFPQKILYAIDVQINLLDPAWPVTAHLLKSAKVSAKPQTNNADTITMQQQLIQKQKELIELQHKKLELELLQTQVKVPRSVTPGLVSIKDMMACISVASDEASQDALAFAHIEPALPILEGHKKRFEPEQDPNSNSPLFFENSMPSIASRGNRVDQNPIDAALSVQPSVVLPSSININDLFQKLVATGIVATKQTIPQLNSKTVRRNPMKVVNFDKVETLKARQNVLYETLYSGMQCSICGMWFSPEQTIYYSQHLDWHFRQNRRVAASRRWYYPLADWKHYEEIDDLKQRERNFFDQQSHEGPEEKEEVEMPSVLASCNEHNSKCEVCHYKFDQFFNEDKEEWHLKNAIQADRKTFHPICYKEYQQSLLDASVDESKEEQKIEEDLVEREDQTIPGLEVIRNDDEVKVVVPEEVMVSESENSKLTQDNKAEETPEEEDDDDVIIHEVVPEYIEVDDDKEYTETTPSAVVQVKVEEIDDGFMDVGEVLINIQNGGLMKIKSEPIDHDHLLLEEVSPEPAQFLALRHPMELSSMDGNTELAQSVSSSTPVIGGKIKINISKKLPVMAAKRPKEVACDSESVSVIDPSQLLPPGEEPIQLNIKPALRAVHLRKMARAKRGRELTGMCSIM